MYYNKLVRDKIPEMIISSGEKPNFRILSQKEYSLALEEKLNEEVQEFHASHDVEELADILEVIFALAVDLGVDRDALMDICQRKHDSRGGFADRIYLISKE